MSYFLLTVSSLLHTRSLHCVIRNVNIIDLKSAIDTDIFDSFTIITRNPLSSFVLLY